MFKELNKKECSNCKHQISYVFHSECSKDYSKCYNNGEYKFFEKFIYIKNLFLKK